MAISQKKRKDDTAIVSVRLPRAMREELDGAAAKAGRSRSEIILLCLEYALANLGANGKER